MPDKLFNDPPDVRVTAYDIYGQSHERPLRNFRFRVSVYGLLQRGGGILVNRHPLQSRYALPGGGVEIGETIERALAREFEEETGLIVRPTRLLDVKESLFTFDGEDAHGILILYAVEPVGGELRVAGRHGDAVDGQFMTAEALRDGKIVPVFESFLRHATTSAPG